MLPAFLFHIYIKAEPPAVSACGGEITHFIMSIIVKAALEGVSRMPLALHSQNMGLHMKHECIRKREKNHRGSHPVLPQGEMARDLQRPHPLRVTASSFGSPQLLS